MSVHTAVAAEVPLYPHPNTPAPWILGVGAFVVLAIALFVVTRLNKDR
jgi:hypothetical protein